MQFVVEQGAMLFGLLMFLAVVGVVANWVLSSRNRGSAGPGRG